MTGNGVRPVPPLGTGPRAAPHRAALSGSALPGTL